MKPRRVVPPTGASPLSSTLLRRVSVDTPEHVRLDYVLADLGSRAAALALDLALMVASVLVVVLLAIPLARSGFDVLQLGQVFLVFAGFLLTWGYFILFEGLRGGRTPGKRAMGLRVIHVGGEPVSFQGAVLRNLVRVVDMQPGYCGMAGAVCILTSSRAQRLGDLVAGTVVVRDVAAGDLLEIDERPRARVARPSLTSEQFELLAGYVARREALAPAVRSRLAASVEQALGPTTAGTAEDAGGNSDDRLTRLHAREAPSYAARPEGARLQAALMARERREDWARYAELVSKGGQHGLDGMNEAEIKDFARLYRGMTADLARAQTYGASLGLLGKVRQWVGSGHNLLYRKRGRATISLVRWVAVEFPRQVRGYWRHCLLAGALFYGPGAVTLLAVLEDPVLGRAIAGPAMMTRAENTEKDDIDAPYIEEDVVGPALASRLMTNNVGVTFLAFAGGMLAGVGTLLVLVYNGVLLGAVMGAYANEGVAGVLLAFVFPHGFIELTAICIAGGAGFGLGSALLMPGRRTRAEALADRGRSFVGLIGGTAVMLVAAGLIEGFISPSAVPAAAKFAFGSVTAVLLALYLGFAGRR